MAACLRVGVVVALLVCTTTVVHAGNAYDYQFVSVHQTWNEAADICSSFGGSLATLTRAGILDTFRRFQSAEWQGQPIGDFWVGLSEPASGVYVWPDCSQLDPSSLQVNVTVLGANQLCFRLTDDWALESDSCNSARMFVCEVPVPEGCLYEEVHTGSVLSRTGVTVDSSSACAALCDNTSSCHGYLMSGQLCYMMFSDSGGGNSLVMTTQICEYGELVSVVPAVAVNVDLDPALTCNASAIGTISTTTSSLAATNSAATGTIHSVEEFHHVQLGAVIVYDVQCAFKTRTNTYCSPANTTVCLPVTNDVSWVECDPLSVNGGGSRTLTEEWLQELIANLTVDKKSTNLYLDKFKCKDDPRPSAAAVGLVGAFLLAVPFVLVLVLDLPRLVSFLKNVYHMRQRTRRLLKFRERMRRLTVFPITGMPPVYAGDVGSVTVMKPARNKFTIGSWAN